MRPLSALVLALSLHAVALAADRDLGDAPFEIEADKLVYEQDRNVYEASGNVRVTQSEGRSLEADWVAFNADTRLGVAVGDVQIRDGQDVVRADFATVDFNTLTAMATRASVDAGSVGLVITGESVQRKDENVYSVRSATLTTCRCPPEPGKEQPWELHAREAEIELEGYAVARDVTFHALGVPVFYTPWLAVPVKSGRETGFLLPAIEFSGNNGTMLELPFFWAARDRLNVLLRPQWVSMRGFKNGAEIEYVLGEEGRGEGGFSILANDRQVENDPVAFPYSPDRWAYWLRNELPLPMGFNLGSDINVASDNDYVVDFDDLGVEFSNDRFLDASAWVSWDFQSLFAGLTGSFGNDLQSPNNRDRDDYVLRRLPQLDLATLQLKLGPVPLFFGLDTQYVYFYHDARDRSLQGFASVDGQFFDTGRDGVFNADEPERSGVTDPSGDTDVHQDDFSGFGGSEGDGVFQEGELLADYGHRIEVNPRLTLPLRLGPVETLTEAGFLETLYVPRFGDSESREVWTGRFDSRIRLVRNFGVGASRVRHVVEPRLGFTLVEAGDQAENPLFVPEVEIRPRRLIDHDPRVLTRDLSDRVEDERLLSYAIASRFYGLRGEGASGPREVGSLRLSGGYDFEESETANWFLEGHVAPHANLRFSGLVGYDSNENQADEALVQMSWLSNERFRLRPAGSPERRHVLNVGYRYLRDRNRLFENWLLRDSVYDDFDADLKRVNQLDTSARLALVRNLDLFARGYYSFESSAARGGSIGFQFLSDCGCWDLAVAVEHRTRPSDTRLDLSLRLSGLGGRR